MDGFKVRQWFPRFERWQNIKRFFKVSDPNTDSDHKDDKMWHIRELFEVFVTACKGNFYPNCEEKDLKKKARFCMLGFKRCTLLLGLVRQETSAYAVKRIPTT